MRVKSKGEPVQFNPTHTMRLLVTHPCRGGSMQMGLSGMTIIYRSSCRCCLPAKRFKLSRPSTDMLNINMIMNPTQKNSSGLAGRVGMVRWERLV